MPQPQEQLFRTRSISQDVESDRERVELVARSIEWSLRAARAEQSGLARRLEEITARALGPLGNGTDEYLSRDARDNHRLDHLEQELIKGERRLQQLTNEIAQFEFLRNTLTVRFPDLEQPTRR